MRIGAFVVALALAGACTTDSASIAWRVEFAEPSLADEVVRVEVTLLPGGCDSGLSPLRTYSVTRTMAATEVMGRLDDGRYGLAAIALDTDCAVRARGCVELTLPTAERSVTVIMAAPAAPEMSCPADRCDAGLCTCAAGFESCEGTCVSVADDPRNCGGCGVACEGAELCVLGSCSESCDAPLAVCEGADGLRCANPTSSILHCGGCGGTCSTVGGEPSCAMGTCGIVCNPGFVDCNGDVTDGCERSLNDPASCGACDVACLAGIDCIAPGICADVPVEVVAGTRHGCVRNAGGQVICWGVGPLLRLVPTLPRLGESPTAFDSSAGASETCAVHGGGVQCWSTQAPGRLADHALVDVERVESSGEVLGGFISAPTNSHCAIDSAGALLCWGTNTTGMLGFAAANAGTPTAPDDPMPVLDLGMGGRHACEVTMSGSVRCRGDNAQGQLGAIGSGGPTAVDVPLPALAQRVAAGADHTLAVLQDATVFQWGGGNSDPQQVALPPEAVGVRDVDAGAGFSCAHVDLAGGTGGVYCWGRNNVGQLGDDTGVSSGLVPVAVSDLGDVRSLAVGLAHSCVLDPSGDVRCWGDARMGALGTPIPGTPVRAITGAAEVTAGVAPEGSNHTCLRYASGLVRCFGSDDHGQLIDGPGPGVDTDALTPTDPTGGELSRIVAGEGFTCAARSDGTAQCWGENDLLQLGTDDPPARVELTSGDPLGGIVELAAGADHVCALVTSTGLGFLTPTIHCWGSNSHGQLGVDGPASRVAALLIDSEAPSLVGATAISAGDRFTCAIATSGGVECWGDAANWRLGVDPATVTDGSTPQRVTAISSAVKLASGLAHSCALTRSDEVWCWGSNSELFGEGSGRVSPAVGLFAGAPVQVAVPFDSGEAPLDLALGELVSCALTDRGRVICWGDDSRSQRGADIGGGFGEVSGLTAIHLAVGSTQSCAITEPGDVVCWGTNLSGELGYGDRVARTMPGSPLTLFTE